MTISIDLPPELERKVLARAAELGKDVTSFAVAALDAAVRDTPSFREILKPIHEGFAQPGISDDEMDRLFEEARQEVWEEKLKKENPAR